MLSITISTLNLISCVFQFDQNGCYSNNGTDDIKVHEETKTEWKGPERLWEHNGRAGRGSYSRAGRGGYSRPMLPGITTISFVYA